ncbi:hypothetical protein L1987_52336 [Smallanthus sonchifolius]|uniref:Uncharacterized protein n=1 Tax=Smallanthus sonchifolius TaxID=185202 RepID=A0ACB9ETJ7_9ASTR|nr:hypothetical protein L1987_52336 [Smallanthus sonchifolius]
MYSYSPLTILTCLLLLILHLPAADSDPRATQAGNLTCGTARATTSNFIPTFVQAMEQLSSNLNNSNNNFAVANITNSNSSSNSNSTSFFALIQCHRDLSHTDCLVCYAVSRTAVPACLPAISGRVFLDGCFVRYDNHSFFREAVDPVTDARNCSSRLGVVNDNFGDFQGGFLEFNRSVGELVENVTRSAVNNGGFSVLEMKGVYGLAQCWESLSGEECGVCLDKARIEAVGCLPSREGRSMNAGCFLRYSTEKFFNNDTQGDGGSSGLSSPGAKVAVVLAVVAFLMISSFAGYAAYIRISKRKQAKTCVLYIDYVRMLVYPKSLIAAVRSLNSDKDKVQILSWSQRVGVIIGTAEGLAYLHGVRIIHRDIKSSNILLDKDFSPKISDFGLVRTFATDRSHLTTGIAGTLGYMAPEYIVRGQLTEKADVFSFGVVVLEIACGRKNNAFDEDSGSLLQTVWRIYNEGVVSEAIDPLLKGDFPEHEALKVLKIGLLCTQASATLRPSMEEVVEFFTTNVREQQIPVPQQPPFLNARALVSQRLIKACASNSYKVS